MKSDFKYENMDYHFIRVCHDISENFRRATLYSSFS